MRNYKYAQVLVVLLLAFGLKLHYSLASPNQLRWILAPTTGLVELITGTRFEFESFAGYMSSDRRFLIAASCAGVNFLIASFLMLALRRLWKDRNSKTSWIFIPFAAVCAFLTALVANTVRIVFALWMQRSSFRIDWLSRDQIHRLEGIVVYFVFLLLLFVLTERQLKPRVVLFPLVVYYMITLLLPLLNFAFGRGSFDSQFGAHSILVLVVPLLLILPLAVFHQLRHKRQTRTQNVDTAAVKA